MDGILVLQRRVIANKFNQYFASIASKLNDDTADIVQNMPTDYRQFMPTPTPNSIFFSDCTEYEVEQIISKLENGKSSDFPIRVIKKLSNILTPVLTAHFNSAMAEGTFPSILKIGKITPIFKKDDEQLLENYRPISTLPILEALWLFRL